MGNNNGGAGREGAAKGQAAGGESSALTGTWNLDVKTPFGQHTATLTLTRTGEGTASGDIKSQLGDAALTSVELGEERVEADVSLRLQGREFSAHLSAQVTGAQISGTIKVRDFALAPALKFTGTKQ